MAASLGDLAGIARRAARCVCSAWLCVLVLLERSLQWLFPPPLRSPLQQVLLLGQLLQGRCASGRHSYDSVKHEPTSVLCRIRPRPAALVQPSPSSAPTRP
eukprot:scaffold67259_cov61-Phaeocystis_antarctica.AAC.2